MTAIAPKKRPANNATKGNHGDVAGAEFAHGGVPSTGQAWLATARTYATEARPASCGAVSQPGKSWELVSLVAL